MARFFIPQQASSDELYKTRLLNAKDELCSAHHSLCEAHKYLQSYPTLAEYTDRQLKSVYQAIQDLNGILSNLK